MYAAFKAAREHVGQPTVILTHTIKGWTLGKDFEARNATHQMKKLTKDELKEFRDRLYLPISDAALEAEMLGKMRNVGFSETKWTRYTFGVAGLYSGIKK